MRRVKVVGLVGVLAAVLGAANAAEMAVDFGRTLSIEHTRDAHFNSLALTNDDQIAEIFAGIVLDHTHDATPCAVRLENGTLTLPKSDAQANPERYENLQVRVCGWNVRWNDLSRHEQDSFIRRAEAVLQ